LWKSYLLIRPFSSTACLVVTKSNEQLRHKDDLTYNTSLWHVSCLLKHSWIFNREAELGKFYFENNLHHSYQVSSDLTLVLTD